MVVLTDPTRTIRVNAKGHEVDQTFIKGIIGAMAVDQIINNYIHINFWHKSSR